MRSQRFLLSLLALVLSTAAIFAVQSDRQPRLYSQPDGSQLTLRLIGDEFGHFFLTDDNRMVLRDGNAFYFAEPDPDGAPRPSKVLASDPAKRTQKQVKFLNGVDQQALRQAFSKKALKARGAMQQLNNRASSPFRAPAKAVSSWSGLGKGRFSNSSFPISGSPRVCILLVQFSDVKFTLPDCKTYFTEMGNKSGFNSVLYNSNWTDEDGNQAIYTTPSGSIREYFSSCSNGVFNPQFDVYGPVTLDNTEAYYGAQSGSSSDVRPHLMVRDAVKALDSSVDFSVYDYDSDGKLDMVYVIYAGLAESSGGDGNTIWPHSGYVYSGHKVTYRADGKLLDRYACSSELRCMSGSNYLSSGMGTFCHEFSHVLGLADEYDVNYGSAYSSGVTPGKFSLMDVGNYNFFGIRPPSYSIFQRNAMGWANIEVLSATPRTVEMGHTLSTNKGYAIETSSYGGSANEFYLIENRQPKSWDLSLPGRGMLVWHIAFDQSTWNNNTVNVSQSLQRVNLVSANNSPTTVAGRPFPGTSGVTSFTSSTSPALKTNGGTAIPIPITGISENTSAGTVTFLICGGGAARPIASIDGSDVDVSESTTSSGLYVADITHYGDFSVALRAETGHTIKYKYTQGSYTSGTLNYSSPISVSSSITLEFWSVRDSNGSVSDVTRLNITHMVPNQVEAPVFSPSPGGVERGTRFTIISPTEGATIYYTLNGTVPDPAKSAIYNKPVEISDNTTYGAIAVKENCTDSPVTYAYYFVYKGTVATPVFSVAEGEVEKNSEVTISCGTSGAKIYYTLDGSTPTTSSTLYSGPITIDDAMTINAYAVLDKWHDSAVATAQYTLAQEPDPEPIARDRYTFTFTEDTAYGMTLQSEGSSSYNPNPFTCADVNVNVSMVLRGQNRWWQADGKNEMRFYPESSFELVPDDGYRVIYASLKGAESSKWDKTTFTGFGESVSFAPSISEDAAKLSAVTVDLVELPSFTVSDIGVITSESTYYVEVDGEEEETNLILLFTLTQSNFRHVNRYEIWALENPMAAANSNMMFDVAETTYIGGIQLDGNDISDSEVQVCLPIRIMKDTGVHSLSIRAQAIVTGENPIYYTGWTEDDPSASTGNENFALDSDNLTVSVMPLFNFDLDGAGNGNSGLDDGSTIYYNLQGHRLKSPTPGAPVIVIRNGHPSLRLTR